MIPFAAFAADAAGRPHAVRWTIALLLAGGLARVALVALIGAASSVIQGLFIAQGLVPLGVVILAYLIRPFARDPDVRTALRWAAWAEASVQAFAMHAVIVALMGAAIVTQLVNP